VDGRNTSVIITRYFPTVCAMSTDLIPKLDAIRAQKLIELAHQRFSDQLNEAEERILKNSASSTFPAIADDNCELPPVRGKFIRWIVGDEEAHKFIDPRGIRIWCAAIVEEVSLSDCRIPFPLDFRGCDLAEPLSLVAAKTHEVRFVECTLRKGINADRVVIDGAFVMRCIKSFGEIRFHGATINGHFECAGSQIVVSGNAITLDQATVQGDVLIKARQDGWLRKQFHSSGCIHMNSASVDGDVNCAGAILQLGLENKEESALCLDRTTIGGSLELAQGFQANRAVRAVDASIRNSLQCRGAHLAENGTALNLNRAQIGGSAFLDSDFQASGDTNLSNIQVKNDLSFNGSRVGRIIGEGAMVGGDLIWTNIQDAPHTKRCLNIAGAAVQNLFDDEVSWPTEGNLVLNGLTYRDIDLRMPQDTSQGNTASLPSSIAFDVKKRIAWLKLQKPEDQLKPQPWLQLAKHQREIGHDTSAKHVVYVFRCIKAASSRLPIRISRTMFAALEERPLWIFVPICICLLFGSLFFSRGGQMRAMAPTTSDSYVAWTQNRLANEAYPKFNAFIYTLENSLPIFKLGQNDTWAPDPHYTPLSWFPQSSCLAWTARLSSYAFLSGLRIFLNLFGWFQAIVLGFALTNRFKS
jgi:hypothetical protein